MSYELANGSIPKGAVICHSCDNKRCVNPNHLWAGTQKENLHDMRSKGRAFFPKGERHGKAKITESQYLEIREKCFSYGWIYAKRISQEYGITIRTARAIKNGETWRHLTRDPKA